jgi:hypothetical protein
MPYMGQVLHNEATTGDMLCSYSQAAAYQAAAEDQVNYRYAEEMNEAERVEACERWGVEMDEVDGAPIAPATLTLDDLPAGSLFWQELYNDYDIGQWAWEDFCTGFEEALSSRARVKRWADLGPLYVEVHNQGWQSRDGWRVFDNYKGAADLLSQMLPDTEVVLLVWEDPEDARGLIIECRHHDSMWGSEHYHVARATRARLARHDLRLDEDGELVRIQRRDDRAA